ncbi:unnamed protein product [Pieris brassicae]|uniref:Endonuclease/exonuclease/phosphatase domain-containing protein n=1 Tax=Pieris brassicae TaxID=7116 RepID=A0A9P0SVD1_PIEBR|nr:unnamed protein product [Pieris brassicae]
MEREGPPLERHQNLATRNTITARRRCTSLRGHRAGRPDSLDPDQTAWVPDTIDLVVYRGFPGRIALDVLVDEFLSDHQPVVAELSDSTPSTTPSTTTTQPRRTIEWSVFQTTLDAAPSLPTPSNAQEIDDTAVKLTSLIQNALTAATTTENPKIIEDRLPGRLMKLIAEKRTLRRQWQASRCPRQKADLNRLALKVRRALEDHAKTSWETFVDDATTDWVRLHRLCLSLNGQRDPVRPLKHHDGSYIYSASSRAELFADHMETQFQGNPAKDPVRARRIETAAEDLMRQRIPAEEDPIYISPSAVFRAARSLKARKAPGPDGIPNLALPHLSKRMLASESEDSETPGARALLLFSEADRSSSRSKTPAPLNAPSQQYPKAVA